VRDRLVAIVGADHVTAPTDEHLTDSTEFPRGTAECVVAPATADEVRAVVRLSAELGFAITPVVAGRNVAGIALPRRAGGIVLDLRRLDRIVELDRDAMYVVVEPGVTFGRLKAFLDEEAPELVYTYPFAPPDTSVVNNALLDGLNNLSMRHGAMGRWLNGVGRSWPTGRSCAPAPARWSARGSRGRPCPTSPACSCRPRGRPAS
jgi:FAD/FMN-containing dehydrogenase